MKKNDLQKEYTRMAELLDKREPQKALILCQQFLSKDPINVLLLNIKSECLMQLKKYSEAIDVLKKLTEITPQNIGLWNNLAITYRLAGYLELAIASALNVVKIDPNNPNYMFNLATLYMDKMDFEHALFHLIKANKLSPNQPAILYNISNILFKTTRYIEALKYLDKMPKNIPVHFLYLDIYSKLQWFDKSLAHMQQLQLLVKTAVRYDLSQYVQRLFELGLYQQAKEHISTLKFSTEPNYLSSLLRCEGLEFKEICHIEKLIGTVKYSDENSKNLYFGLYKNFLKHDKDKAYHYLHLANKINDEKLVVQHGDDQLEFKKVKEGFKKVKKTMLQNESDLPIFIIGMPRSGTTLVESILSAHSQVFGAGEIPYFTKLLHQISHPYSQNEVSSQTVYQCMDHLYQCEPQDFEQLAQKYLILLRQHSNTAIRITDKFTYNFLHVGVIHKIFPRAKIIHCVRNPIANCVSLYKHNLGSHHSYSSNFAKMIEYYRLYENLMEFWSKQFPSLNIKTIHYENMVTDFEAQVKQMLDYCELSFEENCLTFHNNKRIVRTLSNQQVRNTIYTDSLEPWKDAEEFYKPLVEAFTSS